MAIYRCNKCGHLAEVAADGIGSILNCPQCVQPNPVYDTGFFVRKVLEKYFALQAALKRMEAEADNQETAASAPLPSLETVNLYDTDQIATDVQHGPIHDWFAARKIQSRPNYRAVDTTGFYDEVAVEIGRNYELLKVVLEQIRYAQSKGLGAIHVNLSKRSQKEAQAITTFCRQLYDYSFLAKYFLQRPEKILRLTLQTSSQIQRFFGGEWMEWFAMMQLLELCQERRISVSCARNLSIVFANEDIRELDVFAILNGRIPVCIECKSGEFRQSIDKYHSLKKRLDLDETQFVVCVLGLSAQQTSGLSSMYELSFVNEGGLKPHLAGLL